MKLLIFSLFFVVNSIAFAATERIIFSSGSRSDQQVSLAEDYYRNIQYTENVPVTRNYCQDLPVTQTVCEWAPARRVCQTRPVCHPTPYGPRCVPTYGCYNVGAQQYCRPVTTIERQCGQQTVFERVTRTRRQFLYRSQANLRLSFDEVPREYSYIEFDVNLIDDQIGLVSTDFAGPIIVSKLLSQTGERRGYYNRHYQISSMNQDDYFRPVSQIPLLASFLGNEVKLEIARTQNIQDIRIQMRLRHRLSGQEYFFTSRYAQLIHGGDLESFLLLDLSRELGMQWSYWSGQLYWMDVTLIREVDGQIINAQLSRPSFTRNRFYF